MALVRSYGTTLCQVVLLGERHERARPLRSASDEKRQGYCFGAQDVLELKWSTLRNFGLVRTSKSCRVRRRDRKAARSRGYSLRYKCSPPGVGGQLTRR